MVWYARLFQNFPQFVVIHSVKGFGIINKAEIYVFLELTALEVPAVLEVPALQADYLLSQPPGKPIILEFTSGLSIILNPSVALNILPFSQLSGI